MVLIGWVTDISVLKNAIPGEQDVKPNNGLAFMFCSAALFLIAARRSEFRFTLLVIISLLLIVIGGLPVIQFFTGFNSGSDDIFKPFINPMFTSFSLQVSPGSALSFTFLGLAFMFIYSEKKLLQKTGQFLLHLVTFLSILAIFGYLYSASSLYKTTYIAPMPLRTSVSLLFISIGSSLLHPELGLTGLLTGSNMGNIMARRLLPITLSAIFIIGYIRVQSMRSHLVSDQSGVILVFISILLITLFVILNTASVLNGIDLQRLSAKEEVDNLNKNLELINHELRVAMQKLELSNQYLEQLAYISAHDIKSPILTLKGLIDVLDKEDAVKPDYKPMLGMITGTINQMQRTNNSLNSILKLRQNLLNPEVHAEETYTLKTIIADVEATLLPQIEAANAEIKLDINSLSETGFPYIHLKSVLYNLISNSLKYRDNLRPLIIKLGAKKLENNAFEFYVEDNGLGIDVERNRDKLFGIFKRFHDHVEGSGVGLHIVKSIVEAHGGTITVNSEPGKGTRFILTWNNLILA